MSDPTVFSNTENTSTPAQAQPASTNPFADQLAGIKKEDGNPKYDSVDKALEALQHSQAYIPELKSTIETKDQEIARLQAELEKRQSVEDVVSRLAQSKPEADTQTAPLQGMTAEDIEALVQSKLEGNAQQAKAQANVQQVSQALSTKFGDKAAEIVTAKAKELGTSVQELEKLSSQNPNMVLAFFNTQPSPTLSQTHGSVVPPTVKPQQEDLAPPERSLLAGATGSMQKDYFNKCRARVYQKFDVKE